jgi:hypothetical protein
MDNRNFDNLFKNQLDSLDETAFPFEDTAWDNMKNALNAQHILPPTKSKWMSLLPIFLFTMLTLNGLIGWKYYYAKQEIIALNKTILALSNPKIGESQILTDNSPKYKNIDTNNSSPKPISAVDNAPTAPIIEKIVERVVEKIIYVPLNSKSLSNTADNHNSIDNSPFNYDNAKINNHLPNHQNTAAANQNDIRNNSSLVDYDNPKTNNHLEENQNITNQNNNSPNISNTTTTILKNMISEIVNDEMVDLVSIKPRGLDNPNDSIATLLDNIIDTTKHHQSKQYFRDYLARISYATEITNFEMGLSSGYDMLYLSSDFNPTSTRYGITGDLSFSIPIQLGTTIDWKETKGELENIEHLAYADEYFDVFPNIGGIYPNDQLTKIETRESVIEFSLFAKYLIQPRHQWSPYFGVGLKGQYDYEQRFEYEYLDGQGGEYEMPYIHQNSKQLGLNTFIGLAGVQYKLMPRFNVRFDAVYNYDYKAHRFDNSQYQWLSASIGVLYNFK